MPVLGADAVGRSYEVIIEARVAKSLVALPVSGGARRTAAGTGTCRRPATGTAPRARQEPGPALV